MPTIVPKTRTDPLRAFAAGAYTVGRRHPLPLVSTSFDVEIRGGLAVVRTHRRFKNGESESIEATITFPVPVHATLFDLEARVAGRTVKAVAQRKIRARRIYEEAIEHGKTTVLHEEVLRGVHMLSVAHIPPGAEIEITTAWATTLTIVGDQGRLRIPLTVGDIYGCSHLADSDELSHGGPNHSAQLTARSSDGSVSLGGGRLEEGRATVTLDAPIDLVVTGWTPRDLHGRAADGREVILRVEPEKAGNANLDVALLIDHSGSMNEPCSGDDLRITKHEAVVSGLRSVARHLQAGDAIDVWEFDNSPTSIGSTRTASGTPRLDSPEALSPGEHLLTLLDRLSGPSGGTEINVAMLEAVANSSARDLMLVTDGKSHALNVHDLARLGRRVTAVLIGEDSLEANVGHLAVLTGGDIFVADGTDLSEVLAAALAGLRRPMHARPSVVGPLLNVTTSRANAVVSAEWRQSVDSIADAAFGRAVAAVAASLGLPLLESEAAAVLAEAEGLVTHLTSLVLFDQAANVLGVPATRKIDLPSPRTASPMFSFAESAIASPPRYKQRLQQDTKASPFRALARSLRELLPLRDAGHSDSVDLSGVGDGLNWDLAPNGLIAGDLSKVDAVASEMIVRASRLQSVMATAVKLGLSPISLVVGLLALSRAASNRSAERVAKAILGARSASPEVEALRHELNI